MSHYHSNPARESDPHALPDLEVWYSKGSRSVRPGESSYEMERAGWYWWLCLPGCLPDTYEPIGPFDTEAAALASAREQS